MSWPNTVTKKDLKIDYFSGTGPGGQHKNKHKNCVRLVHKPTGTKSQCQDFRSRKQNLQTAFRRLADKLIPIMKMEAQRERFAAGHERVRTYSEPRDTVKDHRLPNRTYRYKDIIEGDGFDSLVQDLLES
jgi:peptide chain release factor 1